MLGTLLSPFLFTSSCSLSRSRSPARNDRSIYHPLSARHRGPRRPRDAILAHGAHCRPARPVQGPAGRRCRCRREVCRVDRNGERAGGETGVVLCVLTDGGICVCVCVCVYVPIFIPFLDSHFPFACQSSHPPSHSYSPLPFHPPIISIHHPFLLPVSVHISIDTPIPTPNPPHSPSHSIAPSSHSPSHSRTQSHFPPSPFHSHPQIPSLPRFSRHARTGTKRRSATLPTYPSTGRTRRSRRSSRQTCRARCSKAASSRQVPRLLHSPLSGRRRTLPTLLHWTDP